MEYKKVPTDEVKKSWESNEKQAITYGYGVRHVQALLYFICISLGFISSGHMGVTIVAMTMVKDETDKTISTVKPVHVLVNGTIVIHPTASTEGYIGNFTLIKDFNENITIVDNRTDLGWNVYKTYDWPKSIQEFILGSFFLGCSIMMFPIGLICQRWGGKIPLQIAMFVNGLALFLAPWLITWGGWKILCVLRLFQGLSQSGLYPAANTLLSNWVPVSERGRLTSYVFTGSGIGCVIAFQLGGILAFSRYGWPSTFWVIGVGCFIGFLLITIFGAATPKEHKSISEAEKLYIMGTAENCVETKAKVPWKSVLKSVPVWATIIAHIGNSVSFLFFFMQVPTYMFAVLKVNVISSGILSSLPYLSSCFSSIFFGYLSDFLTNRKIISLKTARRIFNSIAAVIPSFCLILVTYTTDTILAVICFIVFVTANTAIHTGWLINYMDLSPNFSGALMATGNTLTNIFVATVPLIVSNIVIDVTNLYQWRITMFLMAAIAFGANIIFVIFMSADVQSWNNGDDDTVAKKV